MIENIPMTETFWGIGLGVFACGAFYEGSGILWVHWTERNCALCAAVVSALQGLCQVTGIGASLADHTYAPFFIGGYFVGPYLVVLAKKRWQMEGNAAPKARATIPMTNTNDSIVKVPPLGDLYYQVQGALMPFVDSDTTLMSAMTTIYPAITGAIDRTHNEAVEACAKLAERGFARLCRCDEDTIDAGPDVAKAIRVLHRDGPATSNAKEQH